MGLDFGQSLLSTSYQVYASNSINDWCTVEVYRLYLDTLLNGCAEQLLPVNMIVQKTNNSTIYI